MSTIQKIDSHDLTLNNLLDDFYAVPDYQREYVWGEHEVDQLFHDLYEQFSADPKSEYFIGSIVVCPSAKDEAVFELIDGQQRTTTIYLSLCALRDYLKQHNAPMLPQLDTQIAMSKVDSEGNNVFRYRLDLQYEDSGEILVDIAQGNGNLISENGDTRSTTNIKNAYNIARVFFQENFDIDTQGVMRFYGFLTNRVKLIRIKTQSVAHALKIFETINDRGKGLDSMDLLKNLMFMNAKDHDFEKLKDKWKDLVDTLYKPGEKPLRFLRYLIFATYDVDRLKEDEIYTWFVKNKDLCGYERQPLKFVDELLNAAKAYANFINGKDSQGNPNRYLKNMQLLSGAARQHFILLLAARQLPRDLFTQLCKQVENLFFTYIITRENTREFERLFATWAQRLRNVRTEEELLQFLIDHFEPAKRNLSTRFDLTFDTLNANAIQKYRMRYLLGKLTQYVNEEAFGSAGNNHDLQTFINNQVHVEHVLPQTSKPEVLAEFEAPERVKTYIPILGNLVLAERAINTSLGNKPFSQKRPIYAQSTFLLTQSISKKVEVGVNTSIDRAVKDLEPYNKWTTSSIEHRQQVLRKLARKVWEIPDPVRNDGP